MSGPSKKAKSEEMSDELTSALESIDGCQNEIDLLNEKVCIQGDSYAFTFLSILAFALNLMADIPTLSAGQRGDPEGGAKVQ